MNKPMLPIKQFQMYDRCLYVLDAAGRLFGTAPFSGKKDAEWMEYTENLECLPAVPPPTWWTVNPLNMTPTKGDDHDS